MFIPYGRHYIDDADIEAVVSALRKDYISSGPGIGEFEKEFAAYIGVKYAVAVSSGTAALHAACFAIDVHSGDEVITTPLTFAASANCILYCGGTPVFADVDEKTYNIDPGEIEKKITNKTKAIIPVHFTGQPCDMEAIRQLAKKYGLKIIEDAAHANGADYFGKKIGSLSDMTIFSFHPVKHITTCEGGMITTNDEKLYRKLKGFRAYCLTKDPEEFVEKDCEPGHYEIQGLGYNYRISDVMCALGRSQLKKLDSYVARRREIAARYNQELSEVPGIILPYQKDGCNSSWHLYTIQIENEKRREVYTKMKESGIGVDVHYIPVYKHPYYQENGYKDVCCPIAEKIYSQILSIPIFYTLSNEQQTYVIDTIKKIMI